MTWLLLTILSWFIWYTWEDLTWKIQEKYVVENYFERVNMQSPLVYRNWRILWQKCVWVKWCEYTNRTDCWGLIVWYMMQLDLIKSRRKDSDWKSFTYDWWGLNSFRLYTLWKPISRSQSKRWDFVYMEFPSGSRHFAIVCDTWAKHIFDLYKKSYAECREYPFPRKALFSTNWIVEFLNDKWIILEETKQILSILFSTNEEQKQTDEIIEQQQRTDSIGFIEFISDYVSFITYVLKWNDWT